MQQARGRSGERAMGAVVVVGLTLFMACTNDDDPRDAAGALASITMQFEPSFDPTGQGCDPVDLGGGGAPVDEACYCTRSAADEPATLVLRSGTTVVQLLDLTPSSPPDQARLVTLAQTLLPRLP